jgi:S-adenosylmethionine-diacylglycerol 3-amino-3-carboxypropyl transferase
MMLGMSTPPSWVEEAASLPVAFAQVREDARQDLALVGQAGDRVAVLLVASGGCTAAALAANPRVVRLHLVDPNPAQLALARLKLRLLETESPPDRLALLGHVPMPTEGRAPRLESLLAGLGLSPEVLGPPGLVARLGPDHAGRYEEVFVCLREALGGFKEDFAAVLRLDDPAEQARRVDPATPLGQALDDAFDRAMSLDNLVRLFGEGATRNPVEPFARHFARRTRHVLATLPARTNPYLWQMFLGRFPPGAASPWLEAPCPARLPQVTWVQATMDQALAGAPTAFDVVHLSNILDWLSPAQARTTLDRAWEALRPGGWVIVRQLNSSLDVPGLGGKFRWEREQAAVLHAGDRSFFYRALHLGRKA